MEHVDLTNFSLIHRCVHLVHFLPYGRTGLSISTGRCTGDTPPPAPPTLPGPRTPQTGACGPGREELLADRRDVRGAPLSLLAAEPDPDAKTLCLEKRWSAFILELRRRFMASTTAASSSVVCCRSILFHWITCTDGCYKERSKSAEEKGGGLLSVQQRRRRFLVGPSEKLHPRKLAPSRD